jgi:homoserine kinase
MADAVFNVSHAALLMLGLGRGDLDLISRGLADRLHQPHRSRLYPRSLEVVAAAAELGAIGASISGSGPTVLVWTFWQATGQVVGRLEERFGAWATVRRIPFTPLGVDVPEL